jgi:hypothetical protein
MTDPLVFFSSDFNRSAFFLQHSLEEIIDQQVLKVN